MYACDIINPNTVKYFWPHRPRLRGIHGDRGGRDRYASSSEEEEAAAPAAPFSLSPPSLLSLPSFKDVGNEKGGEKEVWVSVFRYLNRAELLACMTVCKAWYKWYVTRFDSTNKTTHTPSSQSISCFRNEIQKMKNKAFKKKKNHPQVYFFLIKNPSININSKLQHYQQLWHYISYT